MVTFVIPPPSGIEARSHERLGMATFFPEEGSTLHNVGRSDHGVSECYADRSLERIFTSTEADAIAALWSIILATFLYCTNLRLGVV